MGAAMSFELNLLQSKLSDFLASNGIRVMKAKGEGFKRDDLLNNVIIGPDDIRIETMGVTSPNSRVVRERRKVSLLLGATDPSALEAKMSQLVPLLNKFVFVQRFPLTISISQSYDTTMRLYLAEIVLSGQIEYVMRW